MIVKAAAALDGCSIDKWQTPVIEVNWHDETTGMMKQLA
jgi:hypothetical protein